MKGKHSKAAKAGEIIIRVVVMTAILVALMRAVEWVTSP